MERATSDLCRALWPVVVFMASVGVAARDADGQKRVPSVGRVGIPESIDRGMMIDAIRKPQRLLQWIPADLPPIRQLRIPESIDRGMMIDAQMRRQRPRGIK